MGDLNEAVVLCREALAVCPPGHLGRSTTLNNLAIRLFYRYRQLGATEDLNEALILHREALLLRPPGHPDRPMSLIHLAVFLSTRYNQLGAIEDLNEAIILDRQALGLYSPGHPDYSTPLNNLALHLSNRYKRLGAVEDLNEAITLGQEALGLRPPGHPNRSMSLINLAIFLSTRYKQLGAIEDLNEAVILDKEALELCPPRNADRPQSLNNLAVNLSTRYLQLGAMEDLDEAIILDREALALRPPGHPSRLMSLNNLAGRLFTRCKQVGGMKDLDEAIILTREALSLFPSGNPDRPTSLNNLAVYLSARYGQIGAVEDLNEAILLGREALVLRPPGHTARPMSLNNLAGDLCARYNQLTAMEDLREAVDFLREVLLLCPPGHPDRSMSLINLSHLLSNRFNKLGTMEDLNEAIVFNREALGLRPSGHPDRSTALDILAVHISTRYHQLGTLEDLDEGTLLAREALALRPQSHPDRSSTLTNLARFLSARHKLEATEHLDEAIILNREALALYPQGHPNRSTTLNNLAVDLTTRYRQFADIEDKEEVFRLYTQLTDAYATASPNDLTASTTWTRVAEEFQHPSMLLAYKTSLGLLIRYLATLPSLPQHLTVLKGLTSSLAADAFSACLRNHSPIDAVELLEQGRGVFWSQLTRLRSPLDDVIASGSAGKALANEFARQTLLVRKALDSPGADQHDRVCNLAVELQKVVTKIRELPDHSRFLLPPLFSHLRTAACEGPVIIVNASQYGCDVLAIFGDDDPIHIPLSITRDGVRELSSRLRLLNVRAKSTDVSKQLAQLLRELWDSVVSPTVDKLQAICPFQSHVWWCPTAEFSLLPLHAAGPYRKGEKNLPQLYISSYTPTLSALIHARRHDVPPSVSVGKRFLAVGQAKASGQSELLSVGTELANIGQRLEGLASFTCIEGVECCIPKVAEALRENEWVHFACHGVPNPKQPFESAFALCDGRFTIEQIIRCELERPQFAYLSACHTTVGDAESPDEVIHLAAAMQFVGFRSVIGTMWAVDDGETNEITSMFYENMIDESGRLDHTRAALALNKTMRKLVGIPLDQRVLYVHFGA